MIGDYLVVALVIGIAVSFVASIHHFWLRDACKEEAQPIVPVKEEGPCGISNPSPSPHQKSRGLSQARIPAVSVMEQRHEIMNEPTCIRRESAVLRTTSCNTTNT